MGTISACMERAGLLTQGAIGAKQINKAMFVDGFGLTLGSVIGELRGQDLEVLHQPRDQRTRRYRCCMSHRI